MKPIGQGDEKFYSYLPFRCLNPASLKYEGSVPELEHKSVGRLKIEAMSISSAVYCKIMGF